MQRNSVPPADRRRSGGLVSEHASRRGLSSRREFLHRGGSALVLMGGVGLAGCGGGSSSGSHGVTKLTLAINPLWSPVIAQPLKVWGRAHNIAVTIRPVPNDTDTYFSQIRTTLEAGSSDVDVFAGDVSWPAQLAANGWLADLTDRFTAPARRAYLPATVASNEWKGKLYGVPLFTDVGLLYYRKDLLERAGYSAPPHTWSELTEMARKVMTDERVRNGFVFTGAQYEGGTLLGVEFVETAGGAVIRDDTVSAFSTAAVEGLQTERDLVSSGIAPQAVADYQEPQAEQAFLSGHSVFMRNWSYILDDLRKPKVSSLHPSQVGVAGIPRRSASVHPVNVGGGWNVYVNGASSHQDEAWKLVQFLTGSAIQKRLAGIGLPPARIALYDDAHLKRTQAYVRQARTEIAQTVTPPKSPYYSDMSALMAKQFNANVRGAIAPRQAAENVQSGLESIVKKSGA